MVNFWHSPLGVLELIKCKALRVRATGIEGEGDRSLLS